MPLLFSLPRFEGMTRWIAGRRRARLVPLLLLAFAAAGAPDAAAQTTPTISINTPSVTEGNSGTATLTFTLTLSAESPEGKESVRYRDAGTGTATAGTDYVALATTENIIVQSNPWFAVFPFRQRHGRCGCGGAMASSWIECEAVRLGGVHA